MERNEEIDKMMDELLDVLDELPMAKHYLKVGWEDEEEPEYLEKAERNVERLEKLGRRLRDNVIRELGKTGTLTVLWNGDVNLVVLPEGKYLVNGKTCWSTSVDGKIAEDFDEVVSIIRGW